jgi:plasmid stability protein
MVSLWFQSGTKMANLTIKNIPDNLYQKLKDRAELNRRSMNSEILVCLEQVLNTPQQDAQTILPRIKELRAKSTRHFLTDEEILKLKSQRR